MSAQSQGGSGKRAGLGQELGAAALDRSTLAEPLLQPRAALGQGLVPRPLPPVLLGRGVQGVKITVL